MWRILKIDDSVFIAVKKCILKQLISFMGHARISKFSVGVELVCIELREQRGRGGAVKAMIVIEDPNFH